MTASTTPTVRLVAGVALAGLVLLVFLLFPAATSHAENVMQAGACDGTYYTVKTGDSWSVISRRTGVSIAALKLANPQALRRHDWVLIGERLCVPSRPSTPQAGSTPIPVQPGGSWYYVKRGDTWNSVARGHGVPVRDLWVANPNALNALQWLYVGQRLWIPGPATATPTTTATPAPSAAVTATVAVTVTAEAAVTPPAAAGTPAATPAPSATVTAVVSPRATPAPTATATAVVSPLATPAPTATAGATATPEATVEPVPAIPDDCPETPEGYADAVLAHLNDPANTPGTLQTWLEACRMLAAGEQGVVIAPITASKSEDVIVTVADPAAKPLSEQGQLLVYHKGAEGYSLAHQVEGVGRIALLEAADINADKKFDLVTSDTSCGVHTCFGTLSVLSWDGKAYADWIADEPTIAAPEYTIKDVTTQGQGKEISVHGGVIGSLGAGPQRVWTETYVSPKGGEYTLLSQDYDPSTCLYHKILDANAAFDAWALDGFDAAIELYKAALTGEKAEACGTIEDEVATLQDFARFRLIVAAVAAGDAGDAPALVAGIKHTGLRAAANTFLTSYATSGSVIQACRDITKLAETDTSTWDFLADWGYANPSLTAGELCPLN